MVMEVVPTPQCVGREFVRQYYTLLNKAPTHVHRFYNNNSSFVHGGLSEFNRGEVEPAVGQKQIHNCIQRLDFRDCHAKITQVDSQATLGNGVVVQVTGELSNGGQPMRRFTQTFVLCAQSPKQYYVHNDIFRYQDLVFGDDEPDQEQNPFDHEEEEPDLPQPQDIPPPAQIEPAQYYPSAPPMPTMNGGGPPEDAPSPTPAAPPPAAQPPAHSPTPPAPLVQPQPPPAQPQPPSNPYISMEPEQQQQRPAAQESDWGHEAETEEEPPVEDENPADEWNDETEIVQPTPQQPPPPAEPVPSSNEPKTYASTLVKSSGGGVSNYNTSSNVPKSPPSPPPTYTRLESRNNETNAQRMRGGGVGARGGGPSVRGVGGRGDGRSPSSRSQPPPSSNDDYAPRNDYGSRDQPTRDQRDSDQMSVEGGGGGMGGERRRYPSYSDDHQLFLGNLPLHASEADLRDLFRQYGSIVDLRIMSKSNLKSQNGNKVPNYGFIIFESVEHVQNTLQARPIYFPVPGEPDVKLNVEEKKSRPRMDLGGGRGGPPRPGQMGPLPPRGGLGRGGQRGGFTRGARPAGFSQRGGPR